jgi:hypothetical protein
LREDETDYLLGVEWNVLGRVNRVLSRWKQPEMGRLGQLYSDADENFLTTFPELEQYPTRDPGPGAFYWGPVVGSGGGAEPVWPDLPGKRVFAYVKRFDGLGELVSALRAKRVATLLYLDGPADAARELECETIKVARERLDMATVARACDAAVLHAGQGTTAALLMAGKPLLNVPLVLEQRLTANAVERLGAGLVAPASSGAGEEVAEQIDALLAEPEHAEAARRFAAKYAAFDPAAQATRMVERVEAMIEEAAPTFSGRKVFAG